MLNICLSLRACFNIQVHVSNYEKTITFYKGGHKIKIVTNIFKIQLIFVLKNIVLIPASKLVKQIRVCLEINFNRFEFITTGLKSTYESTKKQTYPYSTKSIICTISNNLDTLTSCY